jgi:hypothetical protein
VLKLTALRLDMETSSRESDEALPGSTASAGRQAGFGAPGTNGNARAQPPLPTLNLPKGGGAIRGIGEKFTTNPSKGTATMTVPLLVPPGRAGFAPQVHLAYDSGSGNGPFGLGWLLDLPKVSRKTDKGLPQYDDRNESDVFLLSGAEDLVPAFRRDADGNLVRDANGNCSVAEDPRVVGGVNYLVRRYRPRTEGLFARIERWTRQDDGTAHWRSISRDNVTSLYGLDADSRIADPAEPARVFAWLIALSFDDRGQAIRYVYKREDSAGIDLTAAHEANRTDRDRSAQLYPYRILYGNATSLLDTLGPVPGPLDQVAWLFELTFDYGEGYLPPPAAPPAPEETVAFVPNPSGTWAVRRDPFSGARATFEVRTYRRCRRVLAVHHFPAELGTPDYLVGSTDLVYEDSPYGSALVAAGHSGYVLQPDGTYLRRGLPAVEFEYTRSALEDFVVDDFEVQELDAGTVANLPAGLADGHTSWADLDGEGLPGLLSEEAGHWYYRPNRGEGTFGPVHALATLPAGASLGSGQTLLDLSGGGQLDLVSLAESLPGFYERSDDASWQPFRAFRSLPRLNWADPNLRFVDLTGDGHADVLVTADDVFTWFPSLAEDGFDAGVVLRLPRDAAGPRLLFADERQSIFLADMTGDGLSDLVRVEQGQVHYWPNLGYGRFGARVVMDDAPTFGTDDLFDHRRVTPLEMLFRRRPDLGCLELTCQNTYTVLPYLDLVNEVLESFVVHLAEYAADTNTPKQATLEAYNVEDETSGELLAEPQHINDKAYCILKDKVYPFTLPYHQPIDAIRIFLNYLGSSRRELIDTFRSANDPCADPSLTPALRAELNTLYAQLIDRAVDAETLGMTEEEYVILTHEKFGTKRYYEIMLNKTLSDADYAALAKVQTVQEYYGLKPTDDLAATLTLVKKEFLPRTGLLYVDLVAMLKTRLINPNYPSGEALVYLESIRATYRYLQSLVKDSPDPNVRYGDVITALQQGGILWPLLETKFHPNPCQPAAIDLCAQHTDIRKWVLCYFAKVGQLIVLESGDGPQLTLQGDVYIQALNTDVRTWPIRIAHLNYDGSIVSYPVEGRSPGGELIGQVDQKDQVTWIATTVLGQAVSDGLASGNLAVWVADGDQQIIAVITRAGLRKPNGETRVPWLAAPDSCNLDKVRLIHLDGTPVNVDEFDRMQRFIRLWRKLGWSADQVDQAVVGLAPKPAPKPAGCDGGDSCGDGTADGECCANAAAARIPKTFTTDFLHQLADVFTLLDRTGLELPKLLTFWDNIGTGGDPPLYDRLFLTHNLVSLDPVFQRDANGNVLTTPTPLSAHLPVLQAALGLRPADLDSLRTTVPLPDQLTLDTVSAIYRRTLWARLLGIRVTDLPKAGRVTGDPFTDPGTTLAALDLWGRVQDAGFTLPQMDFLLRPYDPAVPAGPDSPLTPSLKAVLQLCKTLYDGLTAIDAAHPDVTDAPDDLVRSSVGLVFDPAVVEQIVGLLDGTTVYSTNAPAGLTITIPDKIGGTNDPETLKTRLKYATSGTGATAAGSIQVTGILTDAETARAKALSANAGWSAALDRVAKQRFNVFNDYLAAYFTPAQLPDAQNNLLAGDVAATTADRGTAPGKRLYFLKAFLPQLRLYLDRQLIVATVAGTVGLGKDVTDLLLGKVITAGTGAGKQSALALLQSIHDEPAGGAGWTGYLIPPTDDAYVFTAIGDTAPPPLVLDGNNVPFTVQQADPNNVWSSAPVPLLGGKLYHFTVADRQATEIQWRSPSTPKAPIPSSALLPDRSCPGVTEVLVKMKQAALVVSGFTLTPDDIRYWEQPPDLDFNAVTAKFWARLQEYAALRDGLPKLDQGLLDLFAWAAKPDDPTKLPAEIAAVTGWAVSDITKLLAAPHYDLNRPDAFRDEVNLVRLQTALLVAHRIGMDIDLLFEWARPTSRFMTCRKIADSIRAAIRARFSAEDYEQAIKPFRDRLRRDQRDALVAYLVVQQPLVDWGVVDADSLFEFFLIDPQMDCCLETSRIKQAISSVQSYVQRCMLGLEADKGGVTADALDRNRWSWLSREVIRTANRKVFVNPENYLVASLRDDKSPFYKDLESDLLQKDLNPQVMNDVLSAYVHQVCDVANLMVVGFYVEEGKDANDTPAVTLVHLFARTRNAPYLYHYRTYDVPNVIWTPWQKVEVDIPNYDLVNSSSREVDESGAYLFPRVWQNRLFLFFPQIARKTQAPDTSSKTNIPSDGSGGLNIPPAVPTEYWEVSMGWSEHRNGKWTPKSLSAQSARVEVAAFSDISKFLFTTDQTSSEVVVTMWDEAGNSHGGFHFDGSHLYVDTAQGPAPARLSKNFEYESGDMDSAQVPDPTLTLPYLADGQSFGADLVLSSPTYQQIILRDSVVPGLMQQLSANGVDGLYQAVAALNGKDANNFGINPYTMNPPAGTFDELSMPNALYNWEIGFHAPMAMIDRLRRSQQFDDALDMLHRIFNPLAKGTADDPVWRFPPFRLIQGDTTVADFLAGLQPNKPEKTITDWRNNPFEPHVIARERPVAYMKWVVMTYIQVLIDYGDYYFRQPSLEAVPLAIQCYVLAAHLHGPPGQLIPKRGKTRPETYKSLLPKWDAFDNALVDLELAFPFSNQTTDIYELVNGSPELPNVFGFATALYFCVPDNPQIRTLRETIDDRLFKIRHCQDMNGVARQLPLFDMPIDPMLLVQAAAAGLSLSSVLSDLNGPMPNYRFYYLLQKAQELCAELKSLGAAFLSAREKEDAEALAQLRAGHDSAIQALVMTVRKQQLDEATRALEALQQSRKAPAQRMQYYLALIGDTTTQVPDGTTDFNPLGNPIEPPVDDGGLKLIANEKEEMDKASTAADWMTGIGVVETLASVFHALPTMNIHGTPLGVGVAVCWGFPNLANATSAVARGLKIYADRLSFESSNAARKATFQRALQERIQQATAGILERHYRPEPPGGAVRPLRPALRLPQRVGAAHASRRATADGPWGACGAPAVLHSRRRRQEEDPRDRGLPVLAERRDAEGPHVPAR